MTSEKQNIYKSLIPVILFLVLIWLVKGGEMITGHPIVNLGNYPRTWHGLLGILTSPLIHSDLKHLGANSVPLFVLGGCLFYFYKEISLKVILLIYLIPGIAVWVGAREAYHIGASGVVYGLAGFLFFSGIVRKDNRLLAITMMITFLYGSMVWGIFPDFFPEENISYESHFWGLVTGSILAFYFRKEGPQRKVYQWELEEEEEPFDEIQINYIPENKKPD
ncbi:MAG: rhomboid family intramembrane serine protease [Bacteroidales bacterium]|nr:rhomboid family intramembrane serine protease [Bacteroidales bacterium]MCF8403956.1 rhomboid family intramembrane serine protease [Bacteroidales bacterium]